MGEGQSIQGNWINKRTGETIFVRDSIIDGDNMVIISDKGNISMDEFSNEYIQMSEELYDESGKIVGKEKINASDLMPINKPMQTFVPKSTVEIEKTKEKVIEEKKTNNEDIIHKVFSKIKSKPKINIDIEWDDFPETEINTLINFLDISKDEIAVYFIKHYFNKDIIIDNTIKILDEKL